MPWIGYRPLYQCWLVPAGGASKYLTNCKRHRSWKDSLLAERSASLAGFLRVMRCLAACAIVVTSIGCENKPAAETSPVKPDSASTRPGFVHLTPEELSRIQLELAPVVQGQILSHREFPATVQANQNELAEVTPLIRGRVVKVYVDVGEDMKT
jgi:multidrug efflux pump subunit AcrA (membrane-fusion protein)